MSDLVGNPEHRFSRVAARIKYNYLLVHNHDISNIRAFASSKNNNLGFREGPAQIGLYSERSKLEA